MWESYCNICIAILYLLYRGSIGQYMHPGSTCVLFSLTRYLPLFGGRLVGRRCGCHRGKCCAASEAQNELRGNLICAQATWRLFCWQDCAWQLHAFTLPKPYLFMTHSYPPRYTVIHGKRVLYAVKYTQTHGDTRSAPFSFLSGNLRKSWKPPEKLQSVRELGLYCWI